MSTQEANTIINRPVMEIFDSAQNETETSEYFEILCKKGLINVPGIAMNSYRSICIKSEILINRIDENLNSPNQGMIGVFGIDSDLVVYKALEKLKTPYEYLGQIHTDENPDIYTLFASRVIEYSQRCFGASNDAEISIVVKPLKEESNDDSYYKQLVSIAAKATRGAHCAYCIKYLKYLKRETGIVGRKFILSVEIGPGAFNYDVLQKLRNINSPDLLILINSLREFKAESENLEESMGLKPSNPYETMYKYFSCNDVIVC